MGSCENSYAKQEDLSASKQFFIRYGLSVSAENKQRQTHWRQGQCYRIKHPTNEFYSNIQVTFQWPTQFKLILIDV